MGICRLMLDAHRREANHEGNDYQRGEDGDYTDMNLREGIDFARWLLEQGYTQFPHDDDINCRLFIKWAINQRKLLAYA